MTQEHEASKALATISEKPLNQYQVKNLREIIEGDYDDLHMGIMTDIENRLSRREDGIRERYDDAASIEDARDKLVKAKAKAEELLQKTVEEVTNSDGTIQISDKISRDSRTGPYQVVVHPHLLEQVGLDQDLRRVNNAAARLKRIVTTVVEREKRAATRVVLMQSLSGAEAVSLIDDVPGKNDIMALVASEMAKNNQDDLEELMTEEELAQAQNIQETE